VCAGANCVSCVRDRDYPASCVRIDERIDIVE
jgi:hypothetical protein